MAFVGFRLPDDLALRLDAVAARKGGRSRFLRGVVQQLVDGAPAAPEVQAPRPTSLKLMLRLREDDVAHLDRLSAEAGMRRTEWALACLRRRLASQPQFNRDQAQALLEARVELRRISRQVSDLVREVRGGDLPVRELEAKLASIEAFQAEVRAELETVRQALRGEATYWSDGDV